SLCFDLVEIIAKMSLAPSINTFSTKNSQYLKPIFKIDVDLVNNMNYHYLNLCNLAKFYFINPIYRQEDFLYEHSI
ncbi:hypothetical protein, partial [Kingella kingae]|uniref:hypothetical protein n=1 Tax=Kingella kingae TaxID=504 RepID=UPI00254A1554